MKYVRHSNEDAIFFLKDVVLLGSNPDIWIAERIVGVSDVYYYRASLKEIKGSEISVAHVANIIYQVVSNRKRFRTFDCLKVLRHLVNSASDSEQLSTKTINLLFGIYKVMIFCGREPIEWCVSSLVKDQALDNDAVNWLLKNEDKSFHIENRLILFPYRHPKIVHWAKVQYQAKNHINRKHRLIAHLIVKEIPRYVQNEESSTILWAIYWAHVSIDIKKKLIVRYSDVSSVESVVKIATYLKEPEIIQSVIDKLSNKKVKDKGSGLVPCLSRTQTLGVLLTA